MSNPIQNKRIVLGVTGSIAAYKAAILTSKLSQAGALVDVILTNSATRFITPLTFQSVTGRKAYVEDDLWGSEGHVTHIALGHEADLLVIAPASANTMAKLANGIGDNLLTVTALAATCPTLIAPAMDAGMFSHPATQTNVKILKSRGVEFTGPMPGHLASGLEGLGRMTEPVEIESRIRFLLGKNGPLAGKRIIVSAGRTEEPIDPVRFITNRSTGKQGYAVAQAALDAGANVTLISGPTTLTPPSGADTILVQTAEQMLNAVINAASNADALIMTAAVADFRPRRYSEEKIKKEKEFSGIELESTSDILKQVNLLRIEKGYPKHVVGFAAESNALLENAALKLKNKGLDLIVANDITKKGAGFGSETNRVIFLFPDGKKQELPTLSKYDVADYLIQQVTAWISKK